MDDGHEHDLTTLAPEVDMAASRALFDRRRARARRRRRAGATVLATAALLAGIGVWAATADDDGVVVDSGMLDGPPTMPDAVPDLTPGPATTEPLPGTTEADVPPTSSDADPAITADGDCIRPRGSSPATFDADAGIYAAYLIGVDTEAGTARFDVIQWLSGDDADAAYHRDHPDEVDGPPNDYYITNDGEQVRTAPVAADVTVGLVRLATTGTAGVKPAAFSELPGYVPAGDPATTVYWLTFADGMITGICEQYRP